MANHKSAAKRARQNLKRNQRNLSIKKAVRTVEKKLLLAISRKDVAAAKQEFRIFESRINKAAQKGILHSKTASRKTGRLGHQVYQISNAAS